MTTAAPPRRRSSEAVSAEVYAVFQAKPGTWLTSSDVAEVSGCARQTAQTHMSKLAAGGVLLHNGQGRGHSAYRTMPAEGEVVELVSPRCAPVADPEPGGPDQYDIRGLDDLLVLALERGVEIPAEAGVDEVRRLLRENSQLSYNPAAMWGRRKLSKDFKSSDEEQRRLKIEGQILATCAAAPTRPRTVAKSIFRNVHEVREIMMDLVRRGRLESRDGYATFATVANA